jgi:drug/metabolite transporter (DMT)-like permease
MLSTSSGYILLGSVVVIWVVSGFFIQRLFAMHYDHPVAMTVISVGLCAGLLIRKLFPGSVSPKSVSLLENPPSTPIGVYKIVILGLIWLTGQLMYNSSLREISVSTSTALSALSPVFTFLLSLVGLRGLQIVRGAAALVCCCTGVLLLASEQGDIVSPTNHSLGIFMATVGSFCYGGFSVLLKRWARDDQSMLDLFGWFGVVALIVGIPLIGLVDRIGMVLSRCLT